MLLFGPGLGLGVRIWAGPGLWLDFGLAGLVFGLVFGLVAGWTQTAWPSYMVTVGWLAFHHRLPWPLMSFLADARRRGVLRQAGANDPRRHPS